MSKHTIVALVLMVLFIVILLLCQGRVNIPIFGTTWVIEDVRLSFALLGSMVMGVIVGALLK